MFRVTTTHASLPATREVDALRRKVRETSRKLTPAMQDALLMPDTTFNRVSSDWDKRASSAPPGSIYDFEDSARESPVGIVLPFVRFDGDVHLGVKLFKTEDQWEYDEPYAVIEHDRDIKSGTFSRERLPEVWRTVPVVETIIAEKKTRPNEKCPCGSGRKFKKCCGR